MTEGDGFRTRDGVRPPNVSRLRQTDAGSAYETSPHPAAGLVTLELRADIL